MTEPATAITDFLMAALAGWFAVDLGRRAGGRADAVWWSRAFALLAAGALAGGTYHGFRGSLGAWVADVLWHASLATAMLASFATMQAAAVQWLTAAAHAAWARVAAIKLAAFMIAGAIGPVFVLVVIDFALTMMFVTGAAIAGRHRHPRAFPAVAAGVTLFLAGALVQQGRVSPAPSFNHNDLFHVIQILGNGCFFVSARLAAVIQSRPPRGSHAP